MTMTDLDQTALLEWPQPRSRLVGLFTDLTLYAATLELALEMGSISTASLKRELPERLQHMRLVQHHAERTVREVLRELRLFGWIETSSDEPVALAFHTLTSEGAEALEVAKTNQRAFRRLLLMQLHRTYVIPGWFVDRLWKINPTGQGEVILPSPPPGWRTSVRLWDDHEWSTELEQITCGIASKAKAANASAFPIDVSIWTAAVRASWNRLSNLRPRQPNAQPSASFSARSRLTEAMREATVKLLFDRRPLGETIADFPGDRPPVYPRTFRGWCPRLEAVEIVFYTDWHPWISGRLLFPTAVFRADAPPERFERAPGIFSPKGTPFYLHQPSWKSIRGAFLKTLVSVHQRLASPLGIMYISLLSLRDEVCRQLRLSAYSFDRFLELALKDLPSDDFHWSVAVETDIRKEQSSASGQFRRPVYIGGVAHSLIALARLHSDQFKENKVVSQ